MHLGVDSRNRAIGYQMAIAPVIELTFENRITSDVSSDRVTR